MKWSSIHDVLKNHFKMLSIKNINDSIIDTIEIFILLIVISFHDLHENYE